MLRRISIILLLAVIMAGCIKEDMSDCGSLRLKFSYTHNKRGENLLAEQVKDIRVYAFDRSTNTLADIIRPGRQAILNGYVDVDLPDGTYTLVAWGGGGEDLMQGGYLDAEMINPPSLTYTSPVQVGNATLSNFRMMLATDPLPGSATDEVIPRDEQFDDLFFAIAEDIKSVSNESRVVNFDFIKNTSTLKVRVTGLSHLLSHAPAPSQPLTIFAKGKNEIYEYDNRIDNYTPTLHNEPPYRAYVGDVMDIDIRMQRLMIDRYSSYPILLYMRDPDTGFDMMYPLNIVENILRVKDAEGNLVYRTQEDIDREDEFSIELSILVDLSVSVSVNGFEIEDVDPDLN